MTYSGSIPRHLLGDPVGKVLCVLPTKEDALHCLRLERGLDVQLPIADLVEKGGEQREKREGKKERERERERVDCVGEGQ